MTPRGACGWPSKHSVSDLVEASVLVVCGFTGFTFASCWCDCIPTTPNSKPCSRNGIRDSKLLISAQNRRPAYDIADIRKAIKSPVGSKAIKYLLAEAPDWIPRITRKRGKKTERLFWQAGGGLSSGSVMKTLRTCG